MEYRKKRAYAKRTYEKEHFECKKSALVELGLQQDLQALDYSGTSAPIGNQYSKTDLYETSWHLHVVNAND
eukprot:1416850-Amphidinium_carterae.1